jgi:hypothetical protein
LLSFHSLSTLSFLLLLVFLLFHLQCHDPTIMFCCLKKYYIPSPNACVSVSRHGTLPSLHCCVQYGNTICKLNFSSYLLALLLSVPPLKTRTWLGHGSVLYYRKYTWFVRRHMWDVTDRCERQNWPMSLTSCSQNRYYVSCSVFNFKM